MTVAGLDNERRRREAKARTAAIQEVLQAAGDAIMALQHLRRLVEDGTERGLLGFEPGDLTGAADDVEHVARAFADCAPETIAAVVYALRVASAEEVPEPPPR